MSYSVRIVKTETGLEIADAMTDLSHYPDALYISGHHVKDGEQGTESVAISVTEQAPAGYTITALQASSGAGRDRRQTTPDA